MRYLILFLFTFANAQIFTENFSVIVDSVKLQQFSAHNAYLPGEYTNDFGSDNKVLNDTTGTFADSTLASTLRSGLMQYFDGNFDFGLGGATGLTQPGTNDFTFACGFRYADGNGSKYAFAQYTSVTDRILYRVDDSGSKIGNIINVKSTTASGTADFTKAAIMNFDEVNIIVFSVDISDTIYFYANGTEITGGTGATGLNPKDNNWTWSSAEFRIGNYAGNRYVGFVDFFFYDRNTALSAKQVKEFTFLSPNWVSGGGAVSRTTGATWGKSQGISGSGLTVKTKDSGISKAIPTTLTTTSKRYQLDFPRANTFSTDSIMFVTDTDSIWHSVPDTVLAGGLGIQVELDAWETGGVVYLDDITIRGYATINTFKKNESYSKFKGF